MAVAAHTCLARSLAAMAKGKGNSMLDIWEGLTSRTGLRKIRTELRCTYGMQSFAVWPRCPMASKACEVDDLRRVDGTDSDSIESNSPLAYLDHRI